MSIIKLSEFFCKGTFASFYANNMMQEYGEYQAEIYYNINYVKKEGIKKKEKKEISMKKI